MKRTPLHMLAIAAATILAVGIATTAHAQDDKECSNATLTGTFRYVNTGFITAPPPIAGPFAGVGTEVFDGKGGTTATAIVSQNGNILAVTISGTYNVNSDCTGTFTLHISPVGITGHSFFVITDNGTELQAINTDPGSVITTVAKKQLGNDKY